MSETCVPSIRIDRLKKDLNAVDQETLSKVLTRSPTRA
jgi:hypothetical protein